MAKLSDIIEQFLLKTLGDEGQVDISRNELASFFSCAPSQINYVLDTRFTLDRGFVIESQRGGGGYVKIIRVPLETANDIDIVESVGAELTEKRMKHMLENIQKEKLISDLERRIVEVALADESLAMPVAMRDLVRAKSFKRILLYILKGRE